jgi:spermidine/putrescine transport system substrate-binding protein
MCIPATSQNKEAAEMYINFMCETEVAVANTLFVGYSTPQIEAEEALPDEVKNNPIAYPSAELLDNMETFNVLPSELSDYMDKEWSNMRSTSESGDGWMIPLLLLAAIVVIVASLLLRRAKKRRNEY